MCSYGANKRQQPLARLPFSPASIGSTEIDYVRILVQRHGILVTQEAAVLARAMPAGITRR